MAKQIKKAPAPSKAKEPASKEGRPTAVIETAELFSLDVNRNVTPEAKSEGKENLLSAQSSHLWVRGSMVFGFIDYEASQSYENEVIARVNASYLLAVRIDDPDLGEDDKKRLMLDLGKLVTWAKFCDLFAVVTAQGNLDLPKLPMKAPEIAPRKDDAEEPASAG